MKIEFKLGLILTCAAGVIGCGESEPDCPGTEPPQTFKVGSTMSGDPAVLVDFWDHYDDGQCIRPLHIAAVAVVWTLADDSVSLASGDTFESRTAVTTCFNPEQWDNTDLQFSFEPGDGTCWTQTTIVLTRAGVTHRVNCIGSARECSIVL